MLRRGILFDDLPQQRKHRGVVARLQSGVEGGQLRHEFGMGKTVLGGPHDARVGRFLDVVPN
ncbi:hypothetical protein D3C72_1398090 [compost metagenome]